LKVPISRRHEGGAADARDRTRGDQLPGRACGDRDRRSDAERDDADDEPPTATVTIAQRAARQRQAREHERVRVDDPLQLAVRRVEVACEPRKRDVQNRVVEARDDDHEAQDPERRPFPAASRHAQTLDGREHGIIRDIRDSTY